MTAAKILRNLAESSRESLEELRLNHNKLTRIPDIIPSFTYLKYLMMEWNAITLINTRSLAFSSKIGYLQFGGNGITTIEPGSFGGIIF